ncbi:MAG: hypothetical protein R3F22_09945 [Lysobacteraceae bacterium]
MSTVFGYSVNQRRVLAELGLSPVRARAVAAATAADLQLRADATDDPLLAAILDWMPGHRAAGESEVRLALPGIDGDGLGDVILMAELRGRPDWKRQLWRRLRRLRRSAGG